MSKEKHFSSFEGASYYVEESSQERSVLLFFTLPILMSIALVFSVLPYALVAAGTVHMVGDWWESIPTELEEDLIPQRTVLLDDKGKQFAQVFTENRVSIAYDDMGDHVVQALIATEDARFFEHGGMDTKGIIRAIINNVVNDNVQGASTITQQLVENLRIQSAMGDEDKIREARASSVRGKIEEVRFAQGIEATHSKEEILESYLNIVYFGNRAYGVEAASQYYFNTNAKNLTIDQAATLVAMLKSPVLYDPVTKPEESRLRRDVVMKSMVKEGFLEDSVYRKLIEKPTKLKITKPKNGCGDSNYPFYCQLVADQFLQNTQLGSSRADRQRLWETGGLTIQTHMSRSAMNASDKAISRALNNNNRIAAGTATITPGKGHIVAIGQNRAWGTSKKGRFDKTEIVYANTPAMQVGSTFKPIVAAAALEDGISASTKINSPSPAFFSSLDNPETGFRNANRRGAGSINLRQATKASVNTYFVGVTEQVGVKNVAAMARRLGMKSMPTNLTGREGSIALGAYEASPLELASVYATLAGRGVYCEPVSIKSISRTFSGAPINVKSECRQELNPVIADTVSDSLLSPFEGGGTASGHALNNRRAAGKTGTTNDSAATWFSGYTPQYATSVWIGDPRGGNKYPVRNITAYGRSYGTVFGGTVAAPIWNDLMNEIHKGISPTWFPKPEKFSVTTTSRSVPHIEGMGVNEAVTLLLEGGFSIKFAEENSKALKGITAKNVVAKQSPQSGGRAVSGDVVTLTLTAGSDVFEYIPSTIEDMTKREVKR